MFDGLQTHRTNIWDLCHVREIWESDVWQSDTGYVLARHMSPDEAQQGRGVAWKKSSPKLCMTPFDHRCYIFLPQ